MKKYLTLILLALFILSCSFTATPTAVATLPPTPDPRYGQTFEFTPPAEWGLADERVWVTTLMPYDWKVSAEGVLTTGDIHIPGENEPIVITTIGNVPRELFDNMDEGTALEISGRYWSFNDAGIRYDYFVEEKVTIE